MSTAEQLGSLDADALDLLPDEAAVAALWTNVRLVVVDLETTKDRSNFRAVSLAAVTCRGGFVRGKWQTLLDPGVPIDSDSRAIHGLTDDHVRGEMAFADISDQLRATLEPSDDDELVVFVSHNVRFDAPVLRTEYERLGETMPEVRVLDTAGKLPGAVGLKPENRSLVALADALDIPHNRPHDALADATVCAEAVVKLIELAALRGERSFENLLTEISGDATTLTVKQVIPKSKPGRAARVLPPAHTAGHSQLLAPNAGKRMLASWQDEVSACAVLRCPLLDGRVTNAGPRPERLLPYLEEVLDQRLDAGDAAGAATVLHPMLPILENLGHSNQTKRRNAAKAWSARWSQRLTEVGRCDHRERCPACERREPCALDLWPDALAVAGWGEPTAQSAKKFFETTGAGSGTYFSWLAGGHARLADATLWQCIEYWRTQGQDKRAHQIAQLAWFAGRRHPDIASLYAEQLAQAGDEKSLRKAIAVCRMANRSRHDSSHEGWRRLQGRSRSLAGLLDRMRVRPSGKVDADGNPIPKKRHNPTNPKRQPRRRFQRAALR